MVQSTPASPSRRNSNPPSKTCVWGNYVIALFVIITGVVLYLEYKDESKSVREAVAAIPNTAKGDEKHDNLRLSEHPQLSLSIRTWDGVEVGLVDCTSLFQAKKEIEKMKERIWQDWNITQYPAFLSMMHIPQSSWDIQKAKFTTLILGKGTHGTMGDKSFVVGFSGSSVTAGHDSFFEEAFPQIFYNNMAPVLSKLNVNLTVRNHALGNNPCYAYDACIETHMGDDLDMLTWEQSMNCGRDPRPVETFTRSAVEMKTKPSVLFLLSGTPAWSAKDCDNMNITVDKPPRKTSLSGTELEILKSSFQSLVTHQKYLDEMDFLKDGSDKLHDRYKSTAPMGQNLFPIDQYRCYGPYDRTFSTKTPGGGAPWHPGKNGHKVRGDNLAFTIASILEEAIESIISMSCALKSIPHVSPLSNNASSTRRRLQYSHQSRSLSNSGSNGIGLVKEVIEKFNLTSSLSMESSSLQSVIKYADKHIHEQQDIAVLSSVIAGVNNALLMEKVVQPPLPSVPSHHSVPETNYPPQCFTNYEPRMKNTLDTLAVTPYLNWTKELSFFDVNGVHKSELRHLGYLDRKIIYISHAQGSFISFNIPVKNTSPIWLCECQKGFLKYPTTMADLIDGADVYIQENPKHDKTIVFDAKHARKLDIQLLKEQCYRTTENISPGNHILTVVQKGDKQINLSYLITW